MLSTTQRTQAEIYTHNRFKVYDLCKRRYYYEYIRKLHWPDLCADYELGLSIHKLLDYQAKNFDTEMFLLDTREDIKTMWLNIKEHEVLQLPVVASEWGFNVRAGESNHWLEGRIDRLINSTDKKKFIILDFKTGQKLPKLSGDDWQSVIYLYCVASAKKLNPDSLEFWYFKTEHPIEISKIQYSEAYHLSYEKKICRKIEEIETTSDWTASLDCNCTYCQYKELCHR
jgi:CRISPR/Cas system-associated exonuclease Cas4 (RecB family)